MRVTDRMMYDNAGSFNADARSQVEEATQAAATGLRVNHPGDNPAAAGLIVTHSAATARFEAIATVAGRASDELNAADNALNALSNVLVRVWELSIQMSNDGYDAKSRSDAASEVTSLKAQAISLLNAQVGNRYVFGGDKDSAAPFDALGNYSGDTTVRQIEIAPGVLQNASVRADVIAKGAGGGTDLFATLDALSTALVAGDGPGIRATLDGIDAGTVQLTAGLAQVGGQISAVKAAMTVNQAARDKEKVQVAHLSEADLADSATRLQLAQTALNASLTATALSFKLTLADKIA